MCPWSPKVMFSCKMVPICLLGTAVQMQGVVFSCIFVLSSVYFSVSGSGFSRHYYPRHVHILKSTVRISSFWILN